MTAGCITHSREITTPLRSISYNAETNCIINIPTDASVCVWKLANLILLVMVHCLSWYIIIRPSYRIFHGINNCRYCQRYKFTLIQNEVTWLVEMFQPVNVNYRSISNSAGVIYSSSRMIKQQYIQILTKITYHCIWWHAPKGQTFWI